MAGPQRDIITAQPWTYRRAGSIEIGTVQGQAVALPAHFHDEDQILFVLSGRRRILLGGEAMAVEAGGWALIPAGSVHRSLPEPDGVSGLNLYVPAGDYERSAITRSLEYLWSSGAPQPGPLIASVDAARSGSQATLPARGKSPVDAASHFGVAPRSRVTARAEQAGLSREGFSRAFGRMHGMPPQAFNLVVRLNHARRLLQQGEPIAAVAADAGFADQSHLGRAFRRVFGITPGRYREGRGGITNVPDASPTAS